MAPVQHHPQAKFDPIPPDLDLHALVDNAPHFEWVTRITASQIRKIGAQDFERLVLLHVIHGGKPLVIEKWNSHLPKTLFSGKWLEENYDKKQEIVRDITNQTDIPMTTGHYLRSMKQLANQWSPTNFRDERRQRLYLKDIDCPPEWHDRLQKILPPNIFYLNDNVECRGNAQNDDPDEFDETVSVAPAGDLMSSLPPEMRAQNLMCYIGHEGTYTPAHKEMCASLGQNIMVDASGDENGEKQGSSIWFMTETKDREVVREYFLSMLGHDLEIEKHFAQINAWKKATFPVYVVEQKFGDLILVPPLAAHQVWNRGTRTMKVAWNRTTVETLDKALHEALPRARLVCRDEQYKNKAIIYFTLQKYYGQMQAAEEEANTQMSLLGLGQNIFRNSPRFKQLARDFRALFTLFTEVLVDEMFATKEKDVEFIEFDSNITCSYCRANIFNRFLTCKTCVRHLVTGDEDTYDVCMDCYVMGRSCLCVSGLQWCEQWKWPDLVENYETWRSMVIKNDGFVDYELSPLPLEISRRKFGKKSVAQICQEQLRRRPFKDPTKIEQAPAPEPEPEPSEPELDEEGRPKKKKKKNSRKKKTGDVYKCHVCCHKDYTYRVAMCNNPGCTEAYCYGVLYRAFDLMPKEVMQNERWECPKCLNICNCGACRKQGSTQPYVPKSTLLGHDTRPIADDRSVESLVDFRIHNLSWVKSSGDETRALHSKRMQRLKQAADAEKANAANLAKEVPALPDGEMAESLEAVRQSIANNQDDENHVGAIPEQAEMSGALGHDWSAEHQQNQQPAAQMGEADMTLDLEDQSQYPDPSMLRQDRRFGMGYYEPDDAPDKILFDPYQQPSADAMDDEPEMSEYVKKQIRHAKRRARLEDDNDPDFAGPRSRHRKRPRLDKGGDQADGQNVALDNMDPALFREEDATMQDAPDLQDAPAEPDELLVHESAVNPGPEEGNNETDDHMPYAPNKPSLRHAKPMISYAEAEGGEDEFNEVFIPRSQRPPKGIRDFDPSKQAQDPLDLASAAIRAMGDAPVPTTQEEPSQSAPKKRGRPPGRPRKSETAPKGDETPQAESSAISENRRRGRRSRTSRAAAEVSDAQPEVEDVNPSTDPILDDIEAQLARELAAFDSDGEVAEQASTSPSAAASNELEERSEVDSAQSKPKPKPITMTIDLPSIKPSDSPSGNGEFLSMAERMRLKGKSFKIGQRKSSTAASSSRFTMLSARSTGSPATVTEEVLGKNSSNQNKGKGKANESSVYADYDPYAEEESLHSAAPSPAADYEESSEEEIPASFPKSNFVRSEPAHPVCPSGPTVVRLGSDEEDSYSENQFDDAGSSDSESDDDEDIPARLEKAPAAPAARGRVAIRGRGGRGRGRGRGVARRGVY